ncbi:MAG: hypothetical protein HN368_21840 [Spirochaetales bacterium]|nr:hypothetical protein [Spirochaetales bacterium]
MQYRTFGSTEREVSTLGFGTYGSLSAKGTWTRWAGPITGLNAEACVE